MRPCQIFAANGNESLLYNRLFSLFGEEKASKIWLEYRSDQFRQRHSFPDQQYLDANDEPTAEWVLQQLTIPVPTNEVHQVNEDGFDKIKGAIAKNPHITYILQASGNVRKLYDKIRSAALPNVRLEGTLRTLDMQLSELPSAAYPGFTPIQLDDQVLLDQKRQLFLEREDGTFFSLEEQEELLSIATHVVYKQLVGTGRTNLSDITTQLVKFLSMMKTSVYDNIADGKKIKGFETMTAERGQYLSGLITDAFMQMDKVLGMLVERMEQRGLHIKNKELLDKAWHELLNEELEQTPGEILETQGRGLQDWSAVVFELDPATTASARIKMMLSVIPKSHYVDGALTTTTGIYGAPVFEDFNRIFQEALGVLSQVPPDFDIYLTELAKHTDRPYLQQLAKILADPAKTPEHVRNEFVSVMNKHNESYRVMMWARDRDGQFTSYQIEGNRGNMVQNMLSAWKEQQKSAPLIQRSAEGTITLNKPLLQSLRTRLEKMATLRPDQVIVAAPGLIRDLLAAHGIAVPDAAIDYLVTQVERYTKGTDKEGDLKRQFSITKEGKPNGIFSALVVAEEESGIGGIADGNPLYENQRTLSILAKKLLPFMDGIYSISHQTIEGKKVWDYILHSSLTQQVRQLTAAATPTGPITSKGPVYRGEITQLKPNEIFVFGSNTEGRHGKGAALAARKFGAVLGQAEGLQGQTYAIITKDLTKAKHPSRTPEQIKEQIQKLYEFAKANPGKRFMVAYKAGGTNLNAYSDRQMADFFKAFPIPENIVFEEGFRSLIDGTQEEGVNKLLKALGQNRFTKHNLLLKKWTEQPKLLEQFGVGSLEGMREKLDNTDGVARQDMSDREQLITALNLFANGGKATASFISLTHADKSRSPVFFGVPRVNVFDKGGQEVLTALLYAIRAEYERATTDPDHAASVQYGKGKQLFYFVPEMNFERMQDLVREGALSQEEMNLIWSSEGQLQPLTEATKSAMRPVLTKVAAYSAKQVTDRMTETLLAEGIVSEDGIMVDKRYLQGILNKLGLSFSGKGKKKTWMRVQDNAAYPVATNEALNLIARALARDYGLNALVFNISAAQLFFGDPAEAYKAKDNMSTTDKIRSTMIEYEKRLAKDIAPRILPAWPKDATYRTLVLADFEDSALYTGNKAFAKIDATDAQEVITVQEHLDTLFYRGEIDRTTYDEMMAIANANKGKYYEFDDPKHQGVMMRITKPVYTGRRNEANGDMFHDYVKSAAMVLYPPAIRDTQWDALRNTMEWHDVRRAAFASAYKVGAVTPLQLFKKDGSFDLDVLHNEDLVNASSQTLRRENLGIQQDRPWDEDKAKIKVVTQMDRLIVGGIGSMSFQFRGTEKTGAEMRRRKEEVVKKMADHHTEELLDRFQNPEDLYDWLIKQGTVNGVSENNLLQLSVRVGKDPIIPLAFNGAADKFQRMVLSAVQKALSFKVPGASFVQATGAGFQRMRKLEEGEEIKGIHYVGDYKGDGLRTAEKSKDGKTVKPAQVMVPFSYIQRFFPGARLEDFLDEQGRVVGIPPEILQMVLARIPNQGHNSMLPAEIVAFLPEKMGDTIIVPTAITKQMGSDFDVDKLYVYANKGGLTYGKRPLEETIALVRAEMTAAGVDVAELDAAFNLSEEDRQAYEKRFSDRDAIKAAVQSVLAADEELDPEQLVEILEHLDTLSEEDLERLNEARYRAIRANGFKGTKANYFKLARIKKALTEYNASFAYSQAQKVLAGRGDMYLGRLKQADKERMFRPDDKASELDELLQEYFEIHWSILTSPDVYPLMMSQLDKEDMKSEVSKMAYTNFFDPLYQLKSFLSQKDAKVLVGRGANALIGHAIMEPYHLKLGYKVNLEDGSVREVETPIRIADERTGDAMDLLYISGEGQAEYYEQNYPAGDKRWEKVVAQPRTKGENLSILLSEILDHAKFRTIDALNINSYTFGAYAAFLRLSAKGGYAVSHKYPSRLMQQHAIRQFAFRMAKANDSFSGQFTTDAKASVAIELETEYRKELEHMDPLELERAIQEVLFTPHSLQELLETPETRRDDDWRIAQIAALRLFMQLDAAAKRMGEIQSYFNQLSAGPGDSVLEVYDKHDRVATLLAAEFNPNSGVLGATELIEKGTQAAHLESKAYEMVDALLGKELPIQAMRQASEDLRILTGRDELSQKQQQEIYDALVRHQSTIAADGILWASAAQERRRLMTGDQSLAKRILDAKERLKANGLVRGLRPELSEQTVYGPHTVGFNQGFGIPDSEIVKGWIDLLTSENEEDRALGTDLVRYAWLNNTAFKRHIPTGFLQSSGLADRLRDLKETRFNEHVVGNYGFTEQFVQHHPQYAERVQEDLSDLGYKYPYPPEVFVLPFPSETNSDEFKRFIRTPDGITQFVGYISMYSNGQWLLYKHDSGNPGRYVRIDTLGNKKLTEYTKQDYARSVFPLNNALTPVDFGTTSQFNPEPGVLLTADQAVLIQSELAHSHGFAAAALSAKMNPHNMRWTETMVRIFGAWMALQYKQRDPKTAVIEQYGMEGLKEWFDHYTALTPQQIQDDIQFSWLNVEEGVFDAPVFQAPATRAEANAIGIPVEKAIGEGEVRNALRALSADRTVPSHLRLLAGHLATQPYGMSQALPLTMQVLHTQHSPVEDQRAAAGYENMATNFIMISADGNTRHTGPETMVHEVLHAYITAAQIATEYSDKSQLSKLRKKLETLGINDTNYTIDQLLDHLHQTMLSLKQNQRLMDAILKMDAIYADYVNRLTGYMQKNQHRLSAEEIQRLKYAASKRTEFMVMAQTSKPVIEALNAMMDSNAAQEEPQNLFQKFLALFDQFLQALAETMGIKDIDKQSLLYSALKQVFVMHDEMARWNGKGWDPVQPPTGPQGGQAPQVGMQYAPEQLKAIREIPAFALANKAQDPSSPKPIRERTYVLSGPGGTGKTTVTKAVIEELRKQGLSVAVFTTSHAARLVAQNALSDPQKGTKESVYTIHSGLSVRLDVEETIKRREEVFKRVEVANSMFPPEAVVKMKTSNVIIVDEASMLSTEFYEYMNDDTRRNTTIVLVGDYAQLPAVGDEEQDLFASMTREIPQKTILTQNFRSSIPDVLANIQDYRRWVDEIVGGKTTPLPSWGIFNSDNVKFHADGTEFFEAYFSKFDANSLTNQVMIVYRNESRRRANQKIRERLFGKDVGPDPVPGDHIIMTAEAGLLNNEKLNHFRGETGEEKVYNGERLIFKGKEVKKIDRPNLGIFGMEVEVWTVVHGASGIEIDLFHSPKSKELIKLIKSTSTYDAGSKRMKFNNEEVKKLFRADSMHYSDFKDLLQELEVIELKQEFAYAVTSHKSQGMEFNHVFVVEDDILGVGATTPETKARSLYTAVSRTKQSTTILTQKRQAKAAPGFSTQSQMLASSMGQQGTTLSFPTEAQAISATNLINNTGGEVQALPQIDGTNHLVSMRPATRAQMNGTPLEKAIALLQDRLNEMYHSLNDLKDKARRDERMAKIQELQGQIDELKNQGDMRLVAGYGKRQLEWVKEVIASRTNDANAIMTAYRLASMWSNILELLFTDKNGTSFIADPAIDEVYAEAGKLRAEMASRLMPQFIIDNSVIPLETRDFGQGLEDEFAGTAQSLALYRAKGKVAQELATTLTNAARMRDEEMSRMVVKIQEMVQKYGDVLPSLLEVGQGSMGLISPYTPKFYDWRRELNKKKQTALESARQMTNNINKANMRKAAWDSYRRELLKNATVVDVRALFSDQDGTVLTTPEAQAERARLETAFGKAEADQLIAMAERRLKKYLDLRDGLKAKLEAQLLAGTIDKATADKIYNGWMNHRSPFAFLNNLLAGGKVRYNEGENFTVIVPRADHKEFNSQKWADMKANPRALEAFESVDKLLKGLKKNLPLHVQWGMPPNFFPYVAKQFIHETLSIPEYIKTMPQQFVESITGFESSMKEGIPIKFVDQMPGKDISEYSTDVPVVLEMFASMALHYKHFSRVKDYADMIYAKLAEVNRIRQEQGLSGLTNTLAAAQYNFDYLVYRNPRETEFKLGKIYSANPVLHMRISAKVKELMAKKYDVEDAYAKGTITDTEYLDQLKTIDDELKKYDGMTMYGSRIGDKLISIAQLKALSYNPFSAVANLAFGMLTAATYANGREDYTLKNLFTAMKLMNGSVGKFFSFGGIVTGEVEKVFNIVERTGIMGDVVDSWYGKTQLKTGKKKWWEVIGPYNMMKGSDYYMKAVVTLAMMINKKVTVTVKGQPQEISLFEALDKDGSWNEKDFGPAPTWQSDNVEEQTEWNEFVGRAQRVNTIIMGNQDRNSPKLFNKKILGRLIGQFRLSWLPEGFATRFEDERFDPYLKRAIKGRYRTYADLGLGGSLLVLGRQLASVVSRKDPFQGMRVRKGDEMVPMSDADKTNMRRNFAGIAFTLGLYGALALLKTALSGLGDDDEEEKTTLQIMANMIIRQKQDMMLYASPSVFDTVTRNLIPATDVINDYMKLVSATGKFMFDEDYEFEQWILKVTKAGIPVPQATLVNKIKFMTERDIDDVLK